MKTISLKKSEISKEWWVVNAEDQILGRLASKIAQILRGKHKPNFTPHMDMGDFVIVVNAEKIKVTGNKEKDKTYFRHTGYPGGVKETSLDLLRRKRPESNLTNALQCKTLSTCLLLAEQYLVLAFWCLQKVFPRFY